MLNLRVIASSKEKKLQYENTPFKRKGKIFKSITEETSFCFFKYIRITELDGHRENLTHKIQNLSAYGKI